MNKKITTVSSLKDGQAFIIPSLEDTMSSLRVCYVTETGTTVKGKKKDGITSDWKPFQCQISNSTSVLPVEFKVSEEISEETSEETSEAFEKETSIKKKHERRGRPKIEKHYQIPQGKFLISDFAVLNSVSNQTARNYLDLEISKDKPQIIIIDKKKHSGRGRPLNIYQKI